MRISELPKSSTVLKLTYADYARIADYLFLPHRTYTEETVNWILYSYTDRLCRAKKTPCGPRVTNPR